MTDGMKRKGRPPLPAGDKKAVNLTMRMQPALYERLKNAAEGNCRSISSEAEFRLKESLSYDVRPEDIIVNQYGPDGKLYRTYGY